MDDENEAKDGMDGTDRMDGMEWKKIMALSALQF